MAAHLACRLIHRVNLPEDIPWLEPAKVVESELELFLVGPSSPIEHLAILTSNSIFNSYADYSIDLAF